MKKLLIVAALIAMSASAYATEQSILFEAGFGFGKSGSSEGNDKSKWCKHRDQPGLTYIGARYRYNEAEAHVAKWWGGDGGAAKCDRDSYAVGLGYVIDTISDNEIGTEDVYASWTPGIAYTWGANRDFKGQDASNTNWRNTGNWQVFNRVAVGVPFTDGSDGNDGIVEVAVHRYGTWNPDHGEYFLTLGAGLRDFDVVNDNSGGDRGITPPDDGTGDTIINNDITINIIDGTNNTEVLTNVDLGEGGSGTETTPVE